MAVARNTNIKCIILLIVAVPAAAMADFYGPLTVVKGRIGNGPGEFIITHDDMGDNVPAIRCVEMNYIVTVQSEDSSNYSNVVKMYSNEGRLIGVIRPINISNRYG